MIKNVRPKILQKLRAGDLRTTGKANEVVAEVLKKPALFKSLFAGLKDSDAGVRMRSADALEKISAKKPELLQPFKRQLVKIAERAKQQEVQWHLAQMLSYVSLTEAETKKATNILFSYLDTTESNIVKVFSIQTLAEIASKHQLLKSRVLLKIKGTIRNGSPAVKKRGEKLIKQLQV